MAPFVHSPKIAFQPLTLHAPEPTYYLHHALNQLFKNNKEIICIRDDDRFCVVDNVLFRNMDPITLDEFIEGFGEERFKDADE